MKPIAVPSIAVLLPTYNGAEYIEEQILSILQITGVSIHIFAHDDGSTDDTIAIMQKYSDDITIIDGPSQGGAAQNVFFLMARAPWDDYDYVSLTDQDDVWLPEKLETAVCYMQNEKLDCYSSDVTAFWPDGRTVDIRKSQSLKDFDYFFEGGAPGNTHLYTREVAVFMREHLKNMDTVDRNRIKFHDWFFYALCRGHGLRWGIQPYSGLHYRQHDSNVIGAASGMSAIVYRLKKLFGAEYFNQVDLIANSIGRDVPVPITSDGSLVSRLGRIWTRRNQLRRKKSEGVVLTLALMLRAFKSEPLKEYAK